MKNIVSEIAREIINSPAFNEVLHTIHQESDCFKTIVDVLTNNIETLESSNVTKDLMYCQQQIVNKNCEIKRLESINEELENENSVLNEKLSDSEHEADLEHSRYVRLNLELDKFIKENQILKKSFELLEEENKRLKEIIHNGKF